MGDGGDAEDTDILTEPKEDEALSFNNAVLLPVVLLGCNEVGFFFRNG